MSGLYAAESMDLAVKSGLEFVDWIPKEGPHGVHATDCGLTSLREINAVLRHKHGVEEPVMMAKGCCSVPESDEESAEKIKECLTKIQSPDEPTEDDLDDEIKETAVSFTPSIMLLLQVAELLRKLMFK